jgi:hypothetical protein
MSWVKPSFLWMMYRRMARWSRPSSTRPGRASLRERRRASRFPRAVKNHHAMTIVGPGAPGSQVSEITA